MIYTPRIGQRVCCWYAAKSMPLQGKTGTVLAFNPRAKGPKNVLVRIDAGADTIVPRGNLRRVQ